MRSSSIWFNHFFNSTSGWKRKNSFSLQPEVDFFDIARLGHWYALCAFHTKNILFCDRLITWQHHVVCLWWIIQWAVSLPHRHTTWYSFPRFINQWAAICISLCTILLTCSFTYFLHWLGYPPPFWISVLPKFAPPFQSFRLWPSLTLKFWNQKN